MKAQREMELKLHAFLSLTAKTGLLSSFLTTYFSYNLLYQVLLEKSTAWSLTTRRRWYVTVVTKRWSIITLCCAGLYYLDRCCHNFFNRQIGQNGCHSFQLLVLWIYFSGVYKMNRNQNNDQFVFVFVCVLEWVCKNILHWKNIFICLNKFMKMLTISLKGTY